MSRFRLEWLAALIFGAAIGLTWAWIISPARPPGGTSPASLRADFRDEFRSSIAAAYSASGDLERARARLALLGDSDSASALVAQAQRALAAGEAFEEAQELARLASDLQSGRSSIPTGTATAESVALPAPTSGSDPGVDLTSTVAVMTASPEALFTFSAPTLIPSPAQTRTPIPSPSAQFKLVDKKDVCSPGIVQGLLQINVLDRNGHPMPAVVITITWDQGEDHFFTGYQPEISDGYADYVMQPGTTYSLKVTPLGLPISGLSAPSCPGPDDQTYIGGLALTFAEP